VGVPLGDSRIARLADLLVNYSVRVRVGDWTLVSGDVSALPLIREVHLAVLQAGGHPHVRLTDERLKQNLLRQATDEQLTWFPPTDLTLFQEADVFISLVGSQNTRALTYVDPVRQALHRVGRREVFETYFRRSDSGELRWVIARFPTMAGAQEAEMSLAEYEEFVYQACKVDRPDPNGDWEDLFRRQQAIADWLKDKKEIRVSGPNCDLRLSVAGRTWINAGGRKNMPDGEIFTSPVEDSAEGWVEFSYPGVQAGRVVEGVKLTFAEGKVIEASAAKGEALLKTQLAIDSGSNVMGEFAIGTNDEVARFSGDALFDEKMGGTIHMALGHGFEEAGGVNKSSLHWGLVTDMRDGGQIFADGELFYESGEFKI